MNDADLWMGLTACFGPVLKEAFPDYSPFERMRCAEALADAVKVRRNWFDAQAIDARSDETERLGPQGESAVLKGCALTSPEPNHDPS